MDPDQQLAAMIEKSDNLGVLRHIRAFKLRKPDLVLHHGTILLGQPDLLLKPVTDSTDQQRKQQQQQQRQQQSPSFLSSLTTIFSKINESERLATLEQLTIAALDTNSPSYASHSTTIAERTLTQIRDLVGKESVRYRNLLALCLERQENYTGALAIYNNLLADNPSNVHALRRKYTILRAQQYIPWGQEGGADDASPSLMELTRVREAALVTANGMEIKEALNDYLERNGSDASAWVEMTKICAEVGDYSGAAYSGEEIVLSAPLNAEAHCALGDWYATVGGRENWKAARKHFAQSLELDPDNNLRALFGLVSVAESFLDDVEAAGGGRKKKKREVVNEEDVEMAKDLLKYGTDKLSAVYKGTPMGGLVEKVLGDMER